MNHPDKILIFRQSSLGDVILTLPVVRRIKEAFPDSKIEYLTKSAYAPVVQFHPAVSRLYTFSDNKSFWEILPQLHHTNYDLFLDLQGNFRSALIKSALFPTRTLKYSKRRLAREMVVRRSSLKLTVDHTLNAYLAPLRHLNIDTTPAPPMMALPPDAIQFAGKFLRETGLDKYDKLIAFCPGAKHYEKRWPHEDYKKTALHLLDDPSTAIIVISAKPDNLPANLDITNPRLVPVRDFDILNIAAILSKSRVALTNDSGLMHLANAVGVRALAIFGPTNPRLGFSPTLPGSNIICDDVSCSPCSVHGQKPCFQPEKYCFKDITPERVHTELLKMI
jgi:ADP-heptose:LPS heptosyltransferase